MKKFLWTFLSLSLLLTACSKEQNDDLLLKNDTASSSAVLEKILNMGFSATDIEEFDSFYLVEGDILFEKNQGLSEGSISQQQAQTESIAHLENDIYIYVNSNFSSLNSVVNSATNTVIASLNAAGTRLKFYRTSNPSLANITITRNDYIGSGVCGSAGFPQYGKVYPTVYISEVTLLQTSTTSHSQLTFLIAHEIGHCLGLRHTDKWALEIGAPSSIYVPGTPSTDPSSVMNAATCGYTWNGFSWYDIVALRTIYPIPLVSEGNYTLEVEGSGNRNLFFVFVRDAPDGRNPTYKIVVRYTDYYGNQEQHTLWYSNMFKDNNDLAIGMGLVDASEPEVMEFVSYEIIF